MFCREQKIFEEDDRDENDGRATMLAAFDLLHGMEDAVIGTVRIHEERPHMWMGSRLAVAAAHRQNGGIGTQLIRAAVCLAHARGARRFLAQVQAGRARLFHALHWRTLDQGLLHGRAHHLMQADLAHYPAAEAGDLHLLRDAAC